MKGHIIMNDTKGIDHEKLQAAIEEMKKVLGNNNTEKLEKLFDAKGETKLNLSEKDFKTVKTVIENPDMLKSILSSRKARDVLSEYLKKL